MVLLSLVVAFVSCSGVFLFMFAGEVNRKAAFGRLSLAGSCCCDYNERVCTFPPRKRGLKTFLHV